jgi:methyltransferase
MLVELQRSLANERRLRAAGAVEPPDDVIGIMQFAYPGAFAVMLVEAWLRAATFDTVAAIGALIFVAGKSLKYWAIATLGERWTFRVLVPPGSARSARGPYRFMPHPNYVGIAGELAGAMLLAHAYVTGPFVFLGFVLLMVARVRVEERALAGTMPRT